MSFTEWYEEMFPGRFGHIIYVFKTPKNEECRTDEMVIYVGRAREDRFRQRMAEHYKTSDWIVDGLVCETYKANTLEEAVQLEQQMIKCRKPWWNKAGNEEYLRELHKEFFG